jgi:hypothetical protein
VVQQLYGAWVVVQYLGSRGGIVGEFCLPALDMQGKGMGEVECLSTYCWGVVA